MDPADHQEVYKTFAITWSPNYKYSNRTRIGDNYCNLLDILWKCLEKFKGDTDMVVELNKQQQLHFHGTMFCYKKNQYVTWFKSCVPQLKLKGNLHVVEDENGQSDKWRKYIEKEQEIMRELLTENPVRFNMKYLADRSKLSGLWDEMLTAPKKVPITAPLEKYEKYLDDLAAWESFSQEMKKHKKKNKCTFKQCCGDRSIR